MVFNPVGAVLVFDAAAPRTVTGYARDAISGGHFVFASGANNVVSSGTNSFVTADVLFAAAASGGDFTGVALNNAGSNSPVTVALNGCFIVTAEGTVVAGRHVETTNSHAVAPVTAYNKVIGRALTSAGSEGYCIVNFYG